MKKKHTIIGIGYTENKLERIQFAKTIAEFMHTFQSYGDGKPYIIHLQAVVDVLLEFNPNIHADYIIAAYFHDLVEDTTTTLGLIDKHFGTNVGDIVYGVTNERGRCKRDIQEKTYHKLGTDYRKALVLKLADRIANVRQSKSNRENGHYEKYRKDYPYFRNELFKSNEYVEMWAELDALMELYI